MKKIRYGIVGFGGIAENRIAKEGFGLDVARFSGHPLAELVGATDINSSRRYSAEALGLKWYDSIDELLDDKQIDAIFIATNNSSHAAIAEKSINKGKHCLIEKPIAHTLSDARKLRDLAKRNNVSLAVDHMMMKNVFNTKAQELIQDGKIGAVNDISLHMEFLFGSTMEEAETWRCAKPEEIGGPLGDVGTHCLYMAEYLLIDKITEIACSLTPRTLDINVENGAFIQFKTSRGLTGSARVAFNQPRGGLIGTLSNLGYEVYGSNAVLRSFGTLFQLSGDDSDPVRLRLELDTGLVSDNIDPGERLNIYQLQIGSHAQSVLEKKFTDGSDAIHNLELLFACYRSAEKGSLFIKL
ncbi:MAG: Gfo/Idh/MocA family oxidoreductase [Bacteroidales bacterium]|nr:Gfo/Idh/MocA family oxidoreductase [Bacteroidales bacterium]